MRLIPQRLTALMGHGLNESEAKVYLALLEQPRLSAADLAKVTNVPRSHLYKVLHDLHAQGLVDIVLDDGSRAYRARPFTDFLARRAEELRERLAEVETQARTLGEIMRPPPEGEEMPDAGEVRLVLGRRMVARELDDCLERATREVVVALSDHSVDRFAKVLAPWWSAWERAGRHVEVTLALPAGAHATLDWNDMPHRGRLKLRRFDETRGVLSVVVDEEKLLIIHPIPDSGDARGGRDLALFTNDKAFARSHRQLVLGASRRSALEGAPATT